MSVNGDYLDKYSDKFIQKQLHSHFSKFNYGLAELPAWSGDQVIVNIIMRKQKEGFRQSDSRKRVKTVFEEEEALSKAFQISNFYSNQRLNIVELKQRLEFFKKGQKPQPQQSNHSPPQRLPAAIFNQLPKEMDYNLTEQHSISKFINSGERQAKDAMTTKNVHKNAQNSQHLRSKNHFITDNSPPGDSKTKTPTRECISEHKEEAKRTNYRIVKEIHNNRYELKTKTAFAKREKHSALPLDSLAFQNRLNSKMKRSRAERTDYSKCSGSSLQNSWVELGIQGRVVVKTPQQLESLQNQIVSLWEHYQLLTGILLGLKEGEQQGKNSIVKYVDDVCSEKFEFIRDLINYIQRENPSKTEASFMKRLKKAFIMGKLYQNLALVYVGLNICLHRPADSHLVNFLGYSSSNVVFLLKFVLLCHSINQPLALSTRIEQILGVITQFEEGSYRTQVQRMGQLVLRVEHNNEVISILQHRICGKMGKDFQHTISNFLKHVDLDIQLKHFLEYAHYIFEFLAFHLARTRIIGQFSFVEMAPSPYLNLPHQKTLIIEPWEVLFAIRGENTYIRAYSQAFLSEVGKHWNIVYWTDLMPDQIDDLLTKLPPGKPLYRYHCRYENDRFLKLLWRVGCDVDNTIIIDREEENFKYDRQMGVELPWRGKSKDCRLVEVLNHLAPLLSNNSTPLRKSFPAVKEVLLGIQRLSRQKRRVVMKGGIGANHRKGQGQSMYPKLLFGK